IRDFHVTGVQTCALPIFFITYNYQFISNYLSFFIVVFFDLSQSKNRNENKQMNQPLFHSNNFLNLSKSLSELKSMIILPFPLFERLISTFDCKCSEKCFCAFLYSLGNSVFLTFFAAGFFSERIRFSVSLTDKLSAITFS